MTIRIASFNTQKLNTTKPDEIKFLYDFIIRNKIQVLALQEVSRQEVKDSLLRNLNYGANSRWRGDFVQVTSKKGYTEGYCYIWDTNFVSADIENDKSEKNENPKILTDNASKFVRPPYILRLIPSKRSPFSKVNLELLLANIHVTYGSRILEQEDNDDMITESLLTVRRNEIDSLIDLFSNSRVNHPVFGKNRTAYFVILGDFNLCLRQSLVGPFFETPLDYYKSREKVEIEGKGKNNNKVIEIIQPERTTLRDPAKKKNNSTETIEIYSHNYDHFMLDTSLYGNVQKNETSRYSPIKRQTNGMYAWSDVEKYRKKISDHLPIIFSFHPKTTKK